MPQNLPEYQVNFIVYFVNMNIFIRKIEFLIQTKSWEKNLQIIYDEKDPNKLIEMSNAHLDKYFSLIIANSPNKSQSISQENLNLNDY